MIEIHNAGTEILQSGKPTLDGKTLDDSAEELDFSHQTTFNMRHKVLMAFQNMLEKEPVILSGVAELDETFVPDCYKGKRLPVEVSRAANSGVQTAWQNRCSIRCVTLETAAIGMVCTISATTT